MDDDEKINMQMGSFVHKFLYQLSTGPKEKFDDWEKLFDRLWESDENADVRDIDGINIYMLNAKILLQEIYADEKDSGERVIFADNAISCEEKFKGMIAGSYKITGRTDRLARIAGQTEVVDFKYSKKQSKYELPGNQLCWIALKKKVFCIPRRSLLSISTLTKMLEGARFYFLKEPSKEREIELPAEESAKAQELMLAIKERLDAIIGGDELQPEHNCSECEYCRFQALCGREDYYKTARGNI